MAAVINEFVFNHVGTDTNEFIEVFISPGTVVPAGGYTLLVIEGDGNTAGNVLNVLSVPAANASGIAFTGFLPSNTLQNGTQTVLLVSGNTAATANDLDTNNDGVLDTTPWATLLDSVAVSDGGVDDRTYSAVVLNSANIGGGFTPGGASRIPNGIDTDTASDWKNNDFDLAGIPGFTGTLVAPEVANTPGAPNVAAAGPGVTVTGATPALDEADAGPGTAVTFVLATQPTADVVITFTPDADVSVSVASLTFTPVNWNVAQNVLVDAVDDALVEGPHSGTVVTTASSADPAYAAIAVADIVASIVDNDVVVSTTPIAEIQGAAHTSPKLGQVVTTTGIVVARDTSGTASNGQRGFYLMDPTGDGNDATSEGLFVAVPSGTLPNVGEALTISGTVNEFLVGGAATNLTTTRLVGASWTVDSTGNALPGVTLGAGGRMPPGSIVDDDNFSTFDPGSDGIDFYESLEGMRITVTNTKVTGPTNNFGETWVYTQDQPAGPTTAAGGLLLSETDANPERLQLQTDTGVTPGISLSANVGQELGSVTGVLRYDFGNFELALTQQPVVSGTGVTPETTALAGTATQLLVANYNAENLAATDAQSKFDALAAQIVGNLAAPDILALQEVQDNNGTGAGTVAADATLARLIQAIAAAGGPTYEYVQIDPVDGKDGGAPGGNIRNAFLFNPGRVDYVEGSAFRITDTANSFGEDGAFTASRKPLVADFVFNGQQVTLVNNHFTSKSGSDPLYGPNQPPLDRGLEQRAAQAELVKAFVEGELAQDAAAKVVVLGDLNDFTWKPALQVLTAGPDAPLTDVSEATLPANERYSYVFEGNAQALDHFLVTDALLPGIAFDEVHVNAEFANQTSDHDPSVAALVFAVPDAFPNGISSGDVDQDSAVVWALVSVLGDVTLELTGADGTSAVYVLGVDATNVPVKLAVNGLTADTDYTYTFTDSLGRSLSGTFETAAAVGALHGLSFGVSGDWRGELLPFPAIANAADAGLEFFVKLGDTIYSDVASPAVPADQATTLGEYRAKHAEVYGDQYWQALQQDTPILSMIDDHEVTNDFAGGAPASTDPRVGATTGLVNDSPLYENGLQAFGEYNAIEDRSYGATGDVRTAGEIDLYRYNTYGSDAAGFLLDARSFRDAELTPWNGTPADAPRFLGQSFDPTRTLLGDAQLARLKVDLLDADAKGIVWKFVYVPEPIQNYGPANAQDRFEGYAAERTEILKFIDDNDIENVVFVAADVHGTTVNNLTYQTTPGGAQLALNAFEITTGSVAYDPPFAPVTVEFAAALGLLSPAQVAFYNSLPIAPDADSIVNDKDDFFASLVNSQINAFGYDPLGLNTNLPQARGAIDATLLAGDYVAAHSFGWTRFDIDADTQALTVTTYGIYDSNDTAATPVIVSQFVVARTDALEFTLWRDGVFPGTPAEVAWRDAATGYRYTDETLAGVQNSAALTDSASLADANRFLSSAGDLAISQVNYASGQNFGSAGGPKIATLDWTGDGQALLRLDAAWNSVKNVEVSDFTGKALRVENFVDVALDLSGRTQGQELVLDGIKRGTVDAGSGDDTITIGFDSNETRWNNTVVVDAGAGDDTISIGAASRNYVDGRWTLANAAAVVTGGDGDDTLIGSAARETAVYRGNVGDYVIAVSAGITVITDTNLADGDDGTDTVVGFNALRFADDTLAFSGGIWS